MKIRIFRKIIQAKLFFEQRLTYNSSRRIDTRTVQEGNSINSSELPQEVQDLFALIEWQIWCHQASSLLRITKENLEKDFISFIADLIDPKAGEECLKYLSVRVAAFTSQIYFEVVSLNSALPIQLKFLQSLIENLIEAAKPLRWEGADTDEGDLSCLQEQTSQSIEYLMAEMAVKRGLVVREIITQALQIIPKAERKKFNRRITLDKKALDIIQSFLEAKMIEKNLDQVELQKLAEIIIKNLYQDKNYLFTKAYFYQLLRKSLAEFDQKAR